MISMRVGFASLLVVLASLMTGCLTAKSPLRDIPVPPGLSEKQVEFAILAALAQDPPPAGLSPELEITDRALSAWFGSRYRGSKHWFFEGRDTNRVHAGFSSGDYYLRVGIIYSTSLVSFEIEDSRNLRETSTLIHKAAVTWIQDLEIRIRGMLGQVVLLEPGQSD